MPPYLQNSETQHQVSLIVQQSHPDLLEPDDQEIRQLVRARIEPWDEPSHRVGFAVKDPVY